MDEKIKKLRKESKSLKPAIIIGKNGMNEQIIKLIKDQLTKYDVVKIKILKSYIEDKNKKAVFDDIALKTGGRIVHTIGFTISLTKR